MSPSTTEPEMGQEEKWNPQAPNFTMAAQVVMFVVIATVNVLTLVVMAMTPKLRTIPNMYIAALALSDLVVSFNQLLAIPWTHPVHHEYFETNLSLCLFFKCLLHVNELTSILTIALIGLDRFLYIRQPFWYLRVVTKNKVKLAVLLIWLVSFAIALPVRLTDSGGKYPGCNAYALLYDSEVTGYIHGGLYFAICASLFVSYGFVIRTALKQARAVQAFHKPTLQQQHQLYYRRPNQEVSVVGHQQQQHEHQQRQPQQQQQQKQQQQPLENGDDEVFIASPSSPLAIFTPSPTSASSSQTQLGSPSPPRMCFEDKSEEGRPPRMRLENKLEARLSLRIAKKMAGVFLVLFICWTPYAVIGLVGPTRVGQHLVMISGFFAAFNSAANFGVYALGDREFRCAIGKLFGCGNSCKAGQDDVSQTIHSEVKSSEVSRFSH